MTCEGSKVKRGKTRISFIPGCDRSKSSKSLSSSCHFLSVVSRKKKVIMSITEEEREGQGSNEPTWIRYVDFSNV